MLTYRGDKYVKGKKFKINESTYFFSKYDGEDYLIFEAEDKRSLRISKEDYEEMSRYDIIEADSAKLDDFYEGSSLTFEGCTTDKENIDYLYNWLKDLGAIKEGAGPLPIYTYKGSLMNEKYGLTGSNKYPNDLNFITIMLEDINYTHNLAIKRFEIGGRWFDDIVGNNAMRQEKMNESFEIKLEKLKESCNKEKLEEIAKPEEFEYLNSQISNTIDELVHLAMEAEEAGYSALKRAYEKAADILENYSYSADSIYQKEDGTYGRILSPQEAKDLGIYDAIEKELSKK